MAAIECGAGGSTNSEAVDEINNSIKDVNLISDLPSVDQTIIGSVNVLGYNTVNDGGGDIFNYNVALSTVNDGGIVINGWVRQYSGAAINAKWFGAKGDYVDSITTPSSNDTAAIDKAFAYIETIPNVNTGSENGAREINLKSGGIPLYFPSGGYLYDGLGYIPIDNKVIAVKGDGPNSSVITIGSDIHFIHPTTASKVVSYVELNNIKFNGGRGVFFNEKIDLGSVAYGKRIYNCGFVGYTSCAFGSIQDSDARWMVQQSVFEGGNTGTPVGLLLPNAVAECDISGNSFQGNKYSIVTSLDSSTSSYNIGPNNTFFNTTIGTREADIFFVAGASGTNGKGMRVFGNRFSNENLLNEPNILIADIDTGVASTVFNHLTTVSDNSFTGLSIGNNAISSTDSPTVSKPYGFIHSYAYKIGGLNFINNHISQYREFILTFDSSITNAQIEEGANSTNFAILDHAPSNVNAYDVSSFTNRNGGGIYKYLDNSSLGSGEMLSQYVDGTVNFSNIHTSSNGSNLSKGGSVTVTIIDDSQGNIGKAGDYVYGADQVVVFALTQANATVDNIIWVEADVKKGAVNPLSAINLETKLFTKTLSKTIKLTDKWQRITFPIVLAIDGRSGSDLTIQFAPRKFLDIGVEDSFQVGRLAVYNSQGILPTSLTMIGL